MSATGPGVWRGSRPPILASTSATRLALLREAGIDAETIAPRIDERAIEATVATDPRSLALRLASAKAEDVASARPERFVVGADQVLALDGRVFHKPADAESARHQLGALQGRTHLLHSAVAVARAGATECFVETARLTMRPLGPAAIADYVALVGARASTTVGGYRIEGPGIHLFERIEGDHSTILGLPLLPLLAIFRKHGVLLF